MEGVEASSAYHLKVKILYFENQRGRDSEKELGRVSDAQVVCVCVCLYSTSACAEAEHGICAYYAFCLCVCVYVYVYM